MVKEIVLQAINADTGEELEIEIWDFVSSNQIDIFVKDGSKISIISTDPKVLPQTGNLKRPMPILGGF